MRPFLNFRLVSLPARLAVVASLAFLNVSAWAQGTTRYDAQPGSKVRIEGTSTIHDWTIEGGLIGGFLELDSAVKIDPNQSAITGAVQGKVPAKVSAVIPVRSLKSGKTSMDNVMQEAMKAKDNPQIKYTLLGLTLKEPHAAGTPFELTAIGTLTVAGVIRTNSMVVTMSLVAPNKLKTTGTTPLKMTDFGIQPPAPTIGLGLIKTGDDVKITFEWLTAVPGEAAK
jgi:polyisoprenoid-binding protein YceI